MFVAVGVAILLMHFRPGRAVWIVPRAAVDHALAAIVADWRDAGAPPRERVAQHHEHDRRDSARWDRGEERHPSDRFRQVVEEAGMPRREALIQAGACACGRF